jgi:hypothetical protein
VSYISDQRLGCPNYSGSRLPPPILAATPWSNSSGRAAIGVVLLYVGILSRISLNSTCRNICITQRLKLHGLFPLTLHYVYYMHEYSSFGFLNNIDLLMQEGVSCPRSINSYPLLSTSFCQLINQRPSAFTYSRSISLDAEPDTLAPLS